MVSILGYDSVEQAIEVGNDTEYSLAAYVSGVDMTAPFGGYKMSGNGREWGNFGFHEYLEVKTVIGYSQKQVAE